MQQRAHHSQVPRDAALRQLPLSTVFIGAAVVATLMSTEYLFQFFVWRHWPWDEVMAGWLEVLRDRLVVALMIALSLSAAARVRARGLRWRSALLAASILAGAAAGEVLLLAAGASGSSGDAPAVLGRVARWTVVAGAVAAMWYLWRRAADVGAAEQATQLRHVQIQRQTADLQLEALRSQIEPHFLFNTLATVRRLQQVDPADGARLLACFVGYLCSAQPALHADAATLGREIDLARAYLSVVALRMEGLLQFSFDVPDALRSQPFPPLTIATLVENAVKHGIEPSINGGSIRVSARLLDSAIEVVVADTGVGLQGTGGSGIGLANVRARLSTLYGSAAALTLQGQMPSGVRASLRLPCASRAVAA